MLRCPVAPLRMHHLHLRSGKDSFLACLILAALMLLTFSVPVFSQENKQVEIIQAGSLEGVKIDGEEVRRLVGNVIFRQEDTYMYCDSALFYESSNSIDAFGNVRIEGPRAKLYGDILHYRGNERLADVTGRIVRMTDGKMVLTTGSLQYDLASDMGYYQAGGKVVDKENVLTSKKGYYAAKEKVVFFKDDVVLVNPKYVIKSDTLKYSTPTEIAYFLGPSDINSTGTDSAHIYCEDGWYNTITGKSRFAKNAYIESGESKLQGDSLVYERNTKVGRAWYNVTITDTVQKVIISGGYAWMNEVSGKSFVTGEALLTKVFEADSLFLHADTLFAQQDTATRQKTYIACHRVRVYKPDLQAQCDSLVYSTVDSVIWFYSAPILWNDRNQLTAEKISLQLSGNKITTMDLYADAFICGMEDSLRYNQIKGRQMRGFFNDNRLQRILVTGNGQSVYHIRNKLKQLTGVNQAACSDMMIYLDSARVEKINLIQAPDATLFPIKQTDPSAMRLKGFAWKGWLQPKSKEDIFSWPLSLSKGD